jgi:hypothetical protein
MLASKPKQRPEPLDRNISLPSPLAPPRTDSLSSRAAHLQRFQPGTLRML